MKCHSQLRLHWKADARRSTTTLDSTAPLQLERPISRSLFQIQRVSNQEIPQVNDLLQLLPAWAWEMASG